MRVSNVLLVLTLFVTWSFLSTVQAAPSTHRTEVQKLLDDTQGKAKISVDLQTGYARFIRFPQRGLPSSSISDRSAKPQRRAEDFFRKYGSAFGVKQPNSELKLTASRRDASGAEHSIFQQMHDGINVFGGELRAHFDSTSQMIAANGNFLAGLKVNTTPRLTAEQAAQRAITTVELGRPTTNRQAGDHRERLRDSDSSTLRAISSTLMVFREGLLRGTPGRDYLVYEVEVRNKAVTIREFVYVNAHTGRVIDQITGIHEAINREVYETNITNLVWSEGDAYPTGNADWDNEIDGAGETYNVFASMTAGSYLSYDGLDAKMLTVNNDPEISCPNANWNSVSTNYCTGVTGDDTVAHEWGHAYTEYTNGLIYQWQSGALNESYSDIWGEVVDLLNGRGSDAPGGLRSDGNCSVLGVGSPSVDNSYRWLSGEDDPAFGGAIRDMWHPPCYGDPGKVSDAEYFCSSSDFGGVHSNSGVPNHSFALMMDGGNYNAETISGIGLTKTAHVHWVAQNMLTPSSNFLDHADALESACSSLIGVDLQALSTTTTNAGSSGETITATDCAVVAQVITAVELRMPPTQCNFGPLLDPDAPALCEGLGAVENIALENFEGGTLPVGWTTTQHDVVNPATFDTPDWSVVDGLPAGAGGTYAAFIPDLAIGDCAADDESGAVSMDSPVITLPLDKVPHVAFDHWVGTEQDWDGGNLKLSVNGGAYQVVPNTAYTFNAHNSSLNSSGAGNTNPLAGEPAFTGTDGGEVSGSWGQSQINLTSLAFPGDDIQLRFDFGVDGCNGIIGWYVDQVQTYSCTDEAAPICGDGQLDIGEMCDDGNVEGGDGCSDTCQVEDGWACADPIPPTSGTNIINDGSFEAGTFGGIWDEFSTNFGSPICNVGDCGTGTGTGPSDGSFWTWLGGSSVYEKGYVSQDILIPTTSSDLTFDLEQILCDSADDYASLFVDSNLEWTTFGSSPLCGTLGYTPQSVDLSAYADGDMHELKFQTETFANNGAGSNFFIDNVVLNNNVATSGDVSNCHRIVEDLACNAGTVEFTSGIADSWTTIDNTGVGLTWSNVAGAGEFGNYTDGEGDAATVSSDRFGLADFDTELRSNSFDLSKATAATLDYLVNYQNFANADFLDLDVSTDGGGTWGNLISWNEDHGTFRGTPGEPVSLDLTPYVGESDVRLRWRYYDPTTSDWDWYAQIDNVALSCEIPNQVPDCDGATAAPNLLWPPNHKFNKINIFVSDLDDDPVSIRIDSIFQDEAVKAKGSGKTSPDGKGIGKSAAKVRAERVRNGNGRVYHIGFTADDGQGGVCSGEVLVGVPANRRPGSVPIDDGPRYDSTKR